MDMGFPSELDHQGDCYRPPSEADSILLQATLGCSHNRCAFCGSYRKKRFAIKKQEIWERDLAFAARYCRRQHRVFVMDGDAFAMPMPRWEWLLANIAEKLPWVERVSCYASAKNAALKSDADLARLRELGLSMVYYGVESGHAEVLERIVKGADPKMLAGEAKRLKQAGFVLSVTVILGLAGPEGGLEHAKATGELLSDIDPDFVGALTLTLRRGTPLYDAALRGEFRTVDVAGALRELEVLLERTRLTQGLFSSNHASNYLPIRVRLPQEKDAALALVRRALKGEGALRPEWMRGL